MNPKRWKKGNLSLLCVLDFNFYKAKHSHEVCVYRCFSQFRKSICNKMIAVKMVHSQFAFLDLLIDLKMLQSKCRFIVDSLFLTAANMVVQESLQIVGAPSIEIRALSIRCASYSTLRPVVERLMYSASKERQAIYHCCFDSQRIGKFLTNIAQLAIDLSLLDHLQDSYHSEPKSRRPVVS